jgi:hypothetical protein
VIVGPVPYSAVLSSSQECPTPLVAITATGGVDANVSAAEFFVQARPKHVVFAQLLSPTVIASPIRAADRSEQSKETRFRPTT